MIHPAPWHIEAYGETAVIVLTDTDINEDAYHRLASLASTIKLSPPPGFIELVPAYNSLLVIFDPLVSDGPAITAAIQSLARRLAAQPLNGSAEIIDLPVAYGGEYGPDLAAVAEQAGLSPEEVIAIHCARPYLIYMLGFIPGFPYLGGLDARIATPRLKNPRTKVPAGSVGIAETQTGVYPLDSPGGWKLIGRTPLALFDPSREPPALLRAGKYVRFVPISSERFQQFRQPDQIQPASVPLQPASVPLHPASVPLQPASVPLHPASVPLHPASVPLQPTSATALPIPATFHPASVPLHPASVPLHPASAPALPVPATFHPTFAPALPVPVQIQVAQAQPCITVIKPGAHSSIQDAGRYRYLDCGVPPSGPMDALSMAKANILVDNDPGAACIECTLGGMVLRFETATSIAVTGAPVVLILSDDAGYHLPGQPSPTTSLASSPDTARSNNQATSQANNQATSQANSQANNQANNQATSQAAMNRTIRVKQRSVLTIGLAEAGLRIYIAVAGSIRTAPVMGSRSTFSRARLGGLNGQLLAAGDSLPIQAMVSDKPDQPVSNQQTPTWAVPDRVLPIDYIPAFPATIKVRAIPSHEALSFRPEALSMFFGQNYAVSPKSDRMGCRLEGPALVHARGADIVSSGVLSGTVQVPGDGQPIVLLADRQTTGGYARIAHVIQADLWILGQARPGTQLQFTRCDVAQARAALATQAAMLRGLAAQCQQNSSPMKPDPVPRKADIPLVPDFIPQRVSATGEPAELREFCITVDGVTFQASVEELDG
jgi:KipI family sensor histidine kinase inhibitor